MTPVLREQASASSFSGTNELTLLGVPAATLPQLDGWRPDFSPTSVGTLARRIAPSVPPKLSAIAVPPGATELTLPVHVAGDDVAIVGTFVGRDGRFVRADFGRTRGAKEVVLRVPVRGGLRERGCSESASPASRRSSRTPTAAGRSCAAWPCSGR